MCNCMCVCVNTHIHTHIHAPVTTTSIEHAIDYSMYCAAYNAKYYYYVLCSIQYKTLLLRTASYYYVLSLLLRTASYYYVLST